MKCPRCERGSVEAHVRNDGQIVYFCTDGHTLDSDMYGSMPDTVLAAVQIWVNERLAHQDVQHFTGSYVDSSDFARWVDGKWPR
jgi:hypothetical protein